MHRVYVSGKLKDELKIKQLRNYIWVAVNAHEYYRKKDPHITIVPPFNVEEDDISTVESIIDDKRFKGHDIEAKTLSVYENIHKPYVVQLDVEYNIENKIESLIDELEPYASGQIRKPKSPHITLFKTQGWWDTVPQETKESIQYEIVSTVSIRDTEISRVTTEIL